MFGLLRFLPGLLLIQTAAVLLVLFMPDMNALQSWLQVVAILLVLSLIVAFWFDSMVKYLSKDVIAGERQKFAREREKIRVRAEKEKSRIIQTNAEKTAKEIAKASAKANLKVGASLTAAGGFGVLMLLTEFVTLGLMTLFTAGGALGGYLFRSRQPQNETPTIKVLNRP